MRKLPPHQNGQALLLVLLGMAVVLTIVLSILSRSITDIAVTSREEEALRAFSAAEAGVETAFIIGGSIDPTEIGTASFEADVTNFAEGESEFPYPIPVLSGESIVTWFVAHDDNGDAVCSAQRPCFTGDTIRLCWGNSGTPENDPATPAIEVSVFYNEIPGDNSTTRVARAAFDPSGTRRGDNSFASPDVGGCSFSGKDYAFSKTINLDSDLGIPVGSYTVENGLQYARIRFYYNSILAHIGGVSVNFPGNSTLPGQGVQVDSTGSSGEANRKLEVFKSFGEIPSIFEAAIFSIGGIVK